MKRLLMVLGVFSVLFVSCDSNGGGNEEGKKNEGEDVNRQTKKFFAIDEKGHGYYVEAALSAEGKHCKVWVEKGLNLSAQALSGLVFEYENKIRSRLLDAFSVQGPIDDPETKQVVAQNSLDWADYLGDGDGKLAILLLDMSMDGEDSFIAGYFFPTDLYSKGDPRDPYSQYSNESDIIYMNGNLLSRAPSLFYRSIAHEVQHLINFVNSAFLKRYYDADLEMWDWNQTDLWITEGLSAAAEYVYSGQHTEERLERYNEGGGLIPMGNNFFVWGERPQAILDEYATVYLFFQWLRLQSGGTHQIYKDISLSKLFDYEAVVNAIQGKGNYSGDLNLEWKTLLRDWLAANFLSSANNRSSPKHSYLGELKLSSWYFNGYGHEIKLYPGEGVVSYTESVGKTYGDDPRYGELIKYAGMDYFGGSPMKDNESFADGFLLTYNINTVNGVAQGESHEKLLDWGEISPDKYTPPTNPNYTSKSMRSFVPSAPAARSSKLQRISLWDMIRMKGQEGTFGPSSKKNRKHAED